MNNVHFLASFYVLQHVLPILDQLSKSFQRSTINFSHLKPEIVRAKAALEEVATIEAPIKAFTYDVKEWRMAMSQFSPTENQVTSMTNLLRKYVSALKENIDLRFHNTLPLLGALSIFDPTLISIPALLSFPLMELNLSEYLLPITILRNMTDY